MANLLVKRGGTEEKYDERKIYASIYTSLLLVSTPTKEAEIIAKEIVTLVGRWTAGHAVVSSVDLRNQANLQLRSYSPGASYIYAHHRVLS